MAVRKVGEPLAIPRAIEIEEELATSQPVYLYLTDSSEANKVRIPLHVGDTAEVRCAFISRDLTLNERKSFRNEQSLLDELTVSPEEVVCSIVDPKERVVSVPVTKVVNGVYTASFEVTMLGAYFYRFEGKGLYHAANLRAVHVER